MTGSTAACGRCGLNPATGVAVIDGTRYCHWDEPDPASPWSAPFTVSRRLSCFEQEQVAMLGRHGITRSSWLVDL